ncbi:MAG: hypothetical protein VR73_13690 [Gammaproteobacteria bacterium BRH_c0]|nr:MAG: hypothetical protein VR73_13690 [Gammaproteobacteria bacterium BRH_c0]
MTAEIILLKHPDIRIETNPQIIVCESVPGESAQRSLARLGLTYLPEVGGMGIFATVPPGWSEENVMKIEHNANSNITHTSLWNS